MFSYQTRLFYNEPIFRIFPATVFNDILFYFILRKKSYKYPFFRSPPQFTVRFTCLYKLHEWYTNTIRFIS